MSHVVNTGKVAWNTIQRRTPPQLINHYVRNERPAVSDNSLQYPKPVLACEVTQWPSIENQAFGLV